MLSVKYPRIQGFPSCPTHSDGRSARFFLKIKVRLHSVALLPFAGCTCFVRALQGERISVKTAANLVKMMAYNNKDNLQAGLIVAGYDKYNGGQVR